MTARVQSVLCLFVAAGCSPLESGQGMTMVYPSPRFRDAVRVFVCQPGFRMVGRSTLYCDGRQWSSDRPVCVMQHTSTSSSVSISDAAATVPPSPSSSRYFLPVSPSGFFPTGEFPTSIHKRTYATLTPISGLSSLDVIIHQSHTGVAVTSLDIRTAKTPSGLTYTLQSTSTPTWPNFRSGTSTKTGHSTVTSVVTSSATSAALSANTSRVIATVAAPQPATPQQRATALAKNGTGLEGERGGSRTLTWYAVVVGCSAVALAVVVVVVSAICGVVARSRSPAFRRYQLMDGDEELQPTPAAAAASGRSMFYATQYTELTNSCLNSEQNLPQRVRNSLSDNGCSSV